MTIKCCRNCKPPKRKPGCGDHCPEYQKEKAEYKAEQAWLKKHKEREVHKNQTLGDYPVSPHIIPTAAREGKRRH